MVEDAEVDLRRVFGLIRRRIALIFAVTAAALCLAIALLFILAPVYSATSLIVFDPVHKDLLEPTSQAGSGGADNARIESEVELLRSDAILLHVIASQNLLDAPEFASVPGWRTRMLGAIGLGRTTEPGTGQLMGQVLARLRGAITVQRRGATYLIAVQAQSGDPIKAASLANAVAQAYIDAQIASKVSAMLSSRDVLQARLAQARDEIVLSEAAFNDFLQSSTDQLVSSPGGSAVGRLTGEIGTLSDARLQADQLAGRVQASLAAGNWNSLVGALQSEQVTVLGAQRQALAAQLSSFDPASPTAAGLRDQLTAIEGQLARRADLELTNLRTRVAAIDAQQISLREQLRSTVLQSDLPADILTGLLDLQSKASFAREQYQLLLSRTLELQSQSNLQVADSRIASPALPPSSHFFPSTALFVGIALAAGLALGLLVSIVYESVVGGFMSQEQLEAGLKTRVAAIVPRLKLPPGNDTLADMVITAPRSHFAEAMRRTRIAIDQAGRGKADDQAMLGRVVMLTSAVPGEGKSTMAMALARSYALSGRRTLLIDCDLRQPAIGIQLDIKPQSGLLEILETRSGPGELQPILRHETDTGLSLLLGVQGTERATDTLLASTQFGRLIDEARKLFEIVLLDTPPIGPVVDALYVAPRAHVIVLVTRWASTPQRDSRQAVASLIQAKQPAAEILSLLNAKDETRFARTWQRRTLYDPDYA